VFEDELDRVRIDDLHGVDDAVEADVDRLLLRVYDALVVPAYGFGVEVGAIVNFTLGAGGTHRPYVFQDVPDSARSGT